MPTYYQLLGLAPSANSEEIRQAYRQLAKAYHPDANPNPASVARFQVLNEAHRVLSDPGLRKQYDLLLQAEAMRRRMTPEQQIEAFVAHHAQPFDPAKKVRRNARKDFLRSMTVILTGMAVLASFVYVLTLFFLKPSARMDLSYRGLSEWPSDLTGSRDVVWLNLSHNNYTYLPPEAGSLGRLELLNVTDNQLDSLPHSVFRLRWLYGLHAANNRITHLPTVIERTRNLKVLNLRGNRLQGVPEGLFGLVHLERVDLRGNPIALDSLRTIRSRLKRRVRLLADDQPAED